MNPYAASLGNREPLSALAETPTRIQELVVAVGPPGLSRSYAPGKWSGAQLLVHLAQTEVAFGLRVRMALTTKDYVVQPFDQDAWMAREQATEPDVALATYKCLRGLNLALFRRLSAEERRIAFTHPERGRQNVQDIIEMLAGHELHHLGQFEVIAGRR